jgi:hypothetical protein
MVRSCHPLVALALLLSFATARADIPVVHGEAWAENCGRFTIAPGGGENLVDPGADNDYLIHMYCWDINCDPITTLTATDMWLDRPGDLAPCPAPYSQADQGTDATGYTSFSGTIFGGLNTDAVGGIDCDTTELYIYILGIVLTDDNWEPITVCVTFDSPDLNGDGAVTLPDFARFILDFNCTSGCDPCHDFNEDGFTNTADFAVFANYFNQSTCP